MSIGQDLRQGPTLAHCMSLFGAQGEGVALEGGFKSGWKVVTGGWKKRLFAVGKAVTGGCNRGYWRLRRQPLAVREAVGRLSLANTNRLEDCWRRR